MKELMIIEQSLFNCNLLHNLPFFEKYVDYS